MDLREYEALRIRLDALVKGGDPETPVAACPGWSVRDVVAHLAGLCEDWVHHRLEGYGSNQWTRAQIARFDGQPLDAILVEWERAAKLFALLEDDAVMGPPARWAFGDAITHEADVRAALGSERIPLDTVAIALRGSIGRWRDTLATSGVPPLLLRAPELREWELGVDDGRPRVVVTTTAYDAFRALAGRRSANQVRTWEWSASAEPYLEVGPPYPFQWAADDLID